MADANVTAGAVFETQAEVILGMADAIEKLEKKKKILGGDGPKSIYTNMMEKLVASWELRRKTAEKREKMLEKAVRYRQAEAARSEKRKKKAEKLAERGTDDGCFVPVAGEAHVSLRDDTWNEKFFTVTVRHFASWDEGWQAVKAAFANKCAYGNSLVPYCGVLRPGGGGGSGIRKWQDSAGYRVGLFQCGRKSSKGVSATRVGCEMKALPDQPEFKWYEADDADDAGASGPPAPAGGAPVCALVCIRYCISLYLCLSLYLHPYLCQLAYLAYLVLVVFLYFCICCFMEVYQLY